MKNSSKWWKDPNRRAEVSMKISNGVRKVLSNTKRRLSLSKQVRNSYRYNLWSQNILCRDNWTCQSCGKYGRFKKNKVKIHVHHKTPLKFFLKGIETLEAALLIEGLFDVTNGVCLCVDCHRNTHKPKCHQ